VFALPQEPNRSLARRAVDAPSTALLIPIEIDLPFFHLAGVEKFLAEETAVDFGCKKHVCQFSQRRATSNLLPEDRII
jgi:hypothetical protein